MIWGNIGINQSINFEKISQDLNKEINLLGDKNENRYLTNLKENEPMQGVNASSIADISCIPRASVARKLKKLLSKKIIKRNKKLEYILTDQGKLNQKIESNFSINQKNIALFVTDIFNLIKKSSLKI
jgi:DNA-binding transcriptional regulator LsrR (DeoR family)